MISARNAIQTFFAKRDELNFQYELVQGGVLQVILAKFFCLSSILKFACAVVRSNTCSSYMLKRREIASCGCGERKSRRRWLLILTKAVIFVVDCVRSFTHLLLGHFLNFGCMENLRTANCEGKLLLAAHSWCRDYHSTAAIGV